MSASNHISIELMADLTDQRVPQAEREALMAHLQSCVDCSRSWQRLDHLIGLMLTDDSVDAPQPLMARTLNIFQRQPPQVTAPSRQSRLRRLVAGLSFDSLNAEPAFGFRSAQAGPRQLIFNAEGMDIDLRIAPLGDLWELSGQVLGTECTGGEVQLQGETAAASAWLTELCEFTLAAVTSGNYRLLLRLQDVELEVPQLELGK